MASRSWASLRRSSSLRHTTYRRFSTQTSLTLSGAGSLGLWRLRHAFKPAATFAQHGKAYLLLPAHPDPDDVAYRRLAAFKGFQGGLANHAPISHYRDLA